MKKFCFTLCLTLLFTLTLTGFDYLETIGEAILCDDGFILLSGIAITDNAADEVLLDLNEAEIFDLRTGFTVGQGTIREGDMLRAVYTQCGRAYEVYLHAGEPGSADFMVVVSDNIWYSDDGCAFVTSDGKYRITLSEDSQLLDNYGYEMTFDEIIPGMEMFVWAAFITASFPGQVVPDKIVLR